MFHIPRSRFRSSFRSGFYTFPSSSTSLLSEVIGTIPSEKVYAKVPQKSSARVLTSEECRMEINEKEKKKAEAMKRKREES